MFTRDEDFFYRLRNSWAKMQINCQITCKKDKCERSLDLNLCYDKLLRETINSNLASARAHAFFRLTHSINYFSTYEEARKKRRGKKCKLLISEQGTRLEPKSLYKGRKFANWNQFWHIRSSITTSINHTSKLLTIKTMKSAFLLAILALALIIKCLEAANVGAAGMDMENGASSLDQMSQAEKIIRTKRWGWGKSYWNLQNI